MLFSWLADTTSTFVGVILPAFYTLKSLRYATKRENRQQQLYWLKYWTVYALVSTLDTLANKLLLTYLIPGYSFLKLSFTIWSVLPVTRGAEVIHDKFLAPEFRRREARIDILLAAVVAHTQPLVFQVFTALGGAMLRSLAGVLSKEAAMPEPVEAPRTPDAANMEETDGDDMNAVDNRLARAIKGEAAEEEIEVVYENIVTPPRHEAPRAESDSAPWTAVRRRGRSSRKTKLEMAVDGPSRSTRASSRLAKQKKNR